MLLDAKFRNPWSPGVCGCGCFLCVFALRSSRLRARQRLNDMKVLQECKHAGKHGFGTKGVANYCVYFFLLTPYYYSCAYYFVVLFFSSLNLQVTALLG